MADPSQLSAWIALFLGLYLFAAGAGELRAPNTWWAMLKEFERSPGLRFLTGVAALAIGATIYLVNPWRPGDWLAIAVSVIGGLGVAKGILVLASGDRYLHLARASFSDGREHGCSARSVSAVARGHGRDNNTGILTGVLGPLMAWGETK